MAGDEISAAEYPSVDADQIPWLSEAQMIEVDRIMIEDLNIGLKQMMENAGRHLARVAADVYQPSTVVVLAGTGGNGGAGMVAARNLANWLGPQAVTVQVTREPAPESVPGRQLNILRRMGVRCVADDTPSSAPATTNSSGGLISTAGSDRALLIDAVIGYSLRGAPTGRAESMIRWMNASNMPVLALDTPSGLNVTDGSTPGVVVEADATVTLAAPKIGLRSSLVVGRLFMADISVPPSVYPKVGGAGHPGFAPGPIAQIKHRQ